MLATIWIQAYDSSVVRAWVMQRSGWWLGCLMSNLVAISSATCAVENGKILLLTIGQIDVQYHPDKFQLNRKRTVDCESVWRSRRAPTARPGENRKIELRAIMPGYHPTKFQINWMRTVGCESIWRFQVARSHSAPCGEIKKSGPEQLCDLVSSKILPSVRM